MIFQICNRPDTTQTKTWKRWEIVNNMELENYYLGITHLNLPQIEMLNRLVIIYVFILYGNSIF
jgi:hypothetical protein